MPKTIEVKVFEFKELTPEIQAKVIKKFSDQRWEFGNMLDFFTEDCVNQAKEEGFTIVEKDIQYSFSYSQGDGLSFSCKDFDLESFLNENLPNEKKLLKKVLLANLAYVFKGNDGHYSYAHKNQVDLYNEGSRNKYPNIDKIVDELRTKLEDKYLDLCHKLEKQGYADIEYQLSDECIKEDIEANDYTFLENGEIFNS